MSFDGKCPRCRREARLISLGLENADLENERILKWYMCYNCRLTIRLSYKASLDVIDYEYWNDYWNEQK